MCLDRLTLLHCFNKLLHALKHELAAISSHRVAANQTKSRSTMGLLSITRPLSITGSLSITVTENYRVPVNHRAVINHMVTVNLKLQLYGRYQAQNRQGGKDVRTVQLWMAINCLLLLRVSRVRDIAAAVCLEELPPRNLPVTPGNHCPCPEAINNSFVTAPIGRTMIPNDLL